VTTPAIYTRAGMSRQQQHESCRTTHALIHRYHKGLRHGSGVYKFKGLPPGGMQQATDTEEEEDGADVAQHVEASNRVAEGGVYIGEWNAGCMQGLGILKYDDGER
jgi:hypothetical protein